MPTPPTAPSAQHLAAHAVALACALDTFRATLVAFAKASRSPQAERYCLDCGEIVDENGRCEEHPDTPLCATCGGTGYLPDPTWPTGQGRCYDCNLPTNRCLG